MTHLDSWFLAVWIALRTIWFAIDSSAPSSGCDTTPGTTPWFQNVPKLLCVEWRRIWSWAKIEY